jgi:O-antigen ligase
VAPPVHGAPDLLRSPAFLTALATAAGIGFLGVLLFLYVHYGQAPHRLFKMVFGAVAVVVFVTHPRWALVGVALAMPFVEWLPKSGVPMINGVNLLLGTLLLSALLTSLRDRQPLVWPSRLRTPVLLFLVWVFLAWLKAWILPIASFPPWDRLRQVHQAVTGFYVFLLGHRLLAAMPKQELKVWAQRMAIVMSVAGALGALGGLWQVSGLRYGERVGGGLGDINKMGAFYAMALVWTLAIRRVFSTRPWGRVLFPVVVVLNVVGLLLPNSRGGFVAFLVAGIGLSLSRGLKGLAVGLLLLASTPLWVPDYVRERVTETVQVFHEENRYEALNETSGGRLEFWKAAIRVIGKHPVLGVGFGMMPAATAEVIQRYRNTHNFYLELAGEMGVPALLLLGFLMLRLLRRAWRLSRRAGPGWAAAVGEGTVWVAVALLVANIFGSRFFGFSLCGFLFLAAMLVESLLGDRPGRVEIG